MIPAAIILCDHVGRPERLRTLRDAGDILGIPVFPVTPDLQPHAHAASIAIPKHWLPAGDTLSPCRKLWHKAETLSLAAIGLGHVTPAEHYWIIESDCAAALERWLAMFRDHADNPADFLTWRWWHREEFPAAKWWAHPGTPADYQIIHLLSLYRLSRLAVYHLLAVAEARRETFGETAVASRIHQAGLTLGKLNRTDTHTNCDVFASREDQTIRHRSYINHPVKNDCYGADFLPGHVQSPQSPDIR